MTSFPDKLMLFRLLNSTKNVMKSSNMLPAFHVFKDHKMEEINLSDDFRSHGEFIITPRLFSYIGDI
jgi:hypothetical protein